MEYVDLMEKTMSLHDILMLKSKYRAHRVSLVEMCFTFQEGRLSTGTRPETSVVSVRQVQTPVHQSSEI